MIFLFLQLLFFFLLIENQLEEEHFKFFSERVKSRNQNFSRVIQARKISPIFNYFVSTRFCFLFSFSFFFPQYRHRINLTWFLIRVGWK